MARIHFHSPRDTLDVAGSERYHADSATRDHMWQAFGGEEAGIELLRPYLPDFWRCVPAEEVRYFINGSRTFGGGVIDIEGYSLNIGDIALNTAMDTGSDALRLLARLHAQCELHCWVDGQNRAWLADIVVAGREEGVLREGMGWEELAAFLCAQDDEPVVCSYSVSDSFPNYELLPESHHLKKREARGDDIDDIYDAWDRMRWPTQWKLCMGELRKRPGRIELKPDDWRTYHFGDGITAGKLAEALRSATNEATPLAGETN